MSAFTDIPEEVGLPKAERSRRSKLPDFRKGDRSQSNQPKSPPVMLRARGIDPESAPAKEMRRKLRAYLYIPL